MRYKNYLPYILFLVCLITRLAFFGRYIDDWDGVNFAFALSHGYDALNDQPHFHGYPVYMFVSWIIYNICHSDINALILSGIIFSSLAIIPLYALAFRMFSRQAAVLVSVLYIANPQVWLQAEKTLSDAFGLFFVAAFTYFFYRAIDPVGSWQLAVGSWQLAVGKYPVSSIQHPASNPSIKNQKSKIKNQKSPISLFFLFLGSLTLGLGIGVRISYMAFIITWGFVVFIVCRRFSVKKGILYGLSGLGAGTMVWFGYLVARFGIADYAGKFTSHSKYHFTEEGYSILTATNYIDRLITIFKNIAAHSLGAYWLDTPLIRILPTVIMIIAIVAYLAKERFDLKNKFVSISIAAYILWLIIVQTAVRHTMALVPFILILISAGIFYFINGLKTENRQLKWLLPLMLFFIIAPMSFDSGRLVWLNREIKPPQVALIEYIADNYDRETTKFYCLNTWRLFQYYAPEWSDKWNQHVYFTSRISKADQNLKNRYPQPDNVLISSELYERDKYRDRLHSVKVFERDDYAVAEYNWLALYEFDANQKGKDKQLSKND